MIEMEKVDKEFISTIWVEKYRPKKIDGIILPRKLKTFFSKLIKDKDVPNLLFYSSSPGVGKTTVARVLADQSGADSIYINTSKENGIDTLRTKIDNFATCVSLTGNIKVVILDEFDGATNSLQQAMRASIEEFHKTCRFIFTCNYISKIIEPIQSRCQVVDFNFMSKESSEQMKPMIVNRLKLILSKKGENVSFEENVIEKLVEIYYPDMRKMIGLLQQYSKQTISEIYPKGNIDSGIFNCELISDELIDLIMNKKFHKAREHIISMNYNYSELYRFLYDSFVPKIEPPQKRSQAIPIISEFMWRQSQGVLDPEINFAHCLIDLIGILS